MRQMRTICLPLFAVWVSLVLLAVPADAAVPMLSADYHMMALKSDGTVYTWGRNDWGQLGDGTREDRNSPVRVPGLSGIRAIDASNSVSAAVGEDGKVYTWGLDSFFSPSSCCKPQQSPNLRNVTAVAFSAQTLISLAADGSVYSGHNATPVPGLTGVIAISGSSMGSTLALKSDGTVWAWGLNNWGQLGDGTTTNREIPVRVAGLETVVAISMADQYALALKSDGTVWAWGSNGSSQLGDGTTINRLTPIQVQGLTGVRAIAAGSDHGVAVRQDGTVWDWGIYTARGYGARPAGAVPGITSAVSASAGFQGFTVAMTADGNLSTWGYNNRYGVFGTGSFVTTPGTIYEVVGLNLIGGAAPNALPIAVFTVSPNEARDPYSVVCNAGNSSDPDGSITEYQWSTTGGL